MKNILIAAVLIVVLFFGYSFFLKPEEKGTALLVTESQSENSKVGRELIAILQQMQKLSIDQKIFTSKTFQSLQDFGVQIKPQTRGRTNPFAPIGTDAAAAASIEFGASGASSLR